jgi:hypothetical protein
MPSTSSLVNPSGNKVTADNAANAPFFFEEARTGTFG